MKDDAFFAIAVIYVIATAVNFFIIHWLIKDANEIKRRNSYMLTIGKLIAKIAKAQGVPQDEIDELMGTKPAKK